MSLFSSAITEKLQNHHRKLQFLSVYNLYSITTKLAECRTISTKVTITIIQDKNHSAITWVGKQIMLTSQSTLKLELTHQTLKPTLWVPPSFGQTYFCEAMGSSWGSARSTEPRRSRSWKAYWEHKGPSANRPICQQAHTKPHGDTLQKGEATW